MAFSPWKFVKRFMPGTLVRADGVNSQFEGIEQSFTELDSIYKTEMLLLPAGYASRNKIPNKTLNNALLYFDADANLDVYHLATLDNKVQQAADSATSASNSASTASQHADNASSSASSAANSKTQAEQAANNAIASKDKALNFANAAFNVEVETGKFSALHWANVAQQAANDAQGYASGTANNSLKLNNQPASYYAKASDVLTPVPVGAKFTDTNTWRGITDALTSTDQQVSASANAVRTVYNAAVAAQQKANSSFQIATVTTVGGSLLQHTATGVYRFFNATADLPLGFSAGDNDFIATVRGLHGIPAYENEPNYCRIVLQDVRSFLTWENTRLNGVWQGWRCLSEYQAGHAGAGSTLTIHTAKKVVVTVWDCSGVLNIPEVFESGAIVEVLIYNNGSGLQINTGSWNQYFNGVANGTSNTVTKKGILILESMGNHWRVKGVKSK